MIVFFNPLGLLWLILGIGCAAGLQSIKVIVSAEGKYFLEIIAITILSFDFFYRFFIGKKKGEEIEGLDSNVANHWLLGPSLGGSLMFLPAWSTTVAAYLFLTFVVLPG